MVDTQCSEVVWRVLATHSIRQFPLHLPSRASPCAITFQRDFTTFVSQAGEEDYPDEGSWNNNEIKDSLIHKDASETNGLLASLNTSGHMQCDKDT